MSRAQFPHGIRPVIDMLADASTIAFSSDADTPEVRAAEAEAFELMRTLEWLESDQ